VAIEFVLLFPLFLVVLYIMVSYGLAFAYLHALNSMTTEATRSAMALVITDDDAEVLIESQLDKVIGDHGVLPATVTGCLTDGAGDGRFTYDANSGELVVCLEVPTPLPGIQIGGLSLPGLGETLQSRSSTRLGRLDT
jgi:Flp pilus assembly protein TadG